MSGLFVPLDVEYWHDEKIVEAGKDGAGDPLAELLYVRALTFCKRARNDGRIKRSQIDGFALRIPQPLKRWQYLVDTGAVTQEGTDYVITAWLKRNKSAAEIGDKASKAGTFANHVRHHVNKGIVKVDCDHCPPNSEQRRSESESDSEGAALRSDSDSLQKGEVEGREREGEESSSENNSRLALVPPVDDDDFDRTVSLIVEARCKGRRMDDPTAYMRTVTAEAVKLDGALIRRMLRDGDQPEQIALFVLGHGFATAQEARTRDPIPWCDRECTTCDGTAWVYTDDGLAPCPDRKPQSRPA